MPPAHPPARSDSRGWESGDSCPCRQTRQVELRSEAAFWEVDWQQHAWEGTARSSLLRFSHRNAILAYVWEATP